jgi:vitamin B12 transporter
MIPIFSKQLVLKCLAAGAFAIVLTIDNTAFSLDQANSQLSPSMPVAEPLPGQLEIKETDKDTNDSDFEVTVPSRIQRQPISTPFRSDGVVKDATRPIYVINRQQIEQRGARTAKEAIRFLPGVLGDGTVGTEIGALSGQFIRGSNSNQVLILLDGRPINNLGSGGFDLSQIKSEAIERIELLPGGGSVLYGSDAIGGTINIISRVPSSGAVQGSARVVFGSNGFNEQAVNLSGSIVKDTNFNFGYSRVQAQNNFTFSVPEANFQGVRTNNDLLYNNINFRLDSKLSKRTDISFSTLYLPITVGIPGGVSIPDPVNGQGFFNTLTNNNRRFNDQLLSDVTLKTKLGNSDDSLVTARLYVDFTNSRSDSRTAFADQLIGNPPTLQNRPQIQRRFESRQRSIGTQIQNSWKISPYQNLTTGFDYRNTNVRSIFGSIGNENLNYDSSISQGALFAQYIVDLNPQLTATLGLRQEFSTLINGSVTTPALGAKYRVGEDTTIRANYVRNFRLPTISNLYGLNPTNVGNPSLKPEVGDSYDFGIDQKIGQNSLLRLTYFNNTISDLIAFQRIAPALPSGVSGTWQNLGTVQTQGLEAAFDTQLAPNLFASIGYTLNDPRILNSVNAGENGRELRFAGADKLTAGIWYENAYGWYSGVTLNSLGSYPTNNVNTESLGGYTTFDFRLRAPITPQISATAGVENIFNQRFQLFPGFPDGGRTFQAGIDYRF